VLVFLRALAEVQRQLETAHCELRGKQDANAVVHSHLVMRESAKRDLPAAAGQRSGLWIAAAVVLQPGDATEISWTCLATNSLDGSGWTVEREVVLSESPGEPLTLASAELPLVQFARSVDLAQALPRLIDETLRLPAPVA
jgi:hypothetical protein